MYSQITSTQAHKQEMSYAQAHKQETFLCSSTTTRDLQMLKYTSKRLTIKQTYIEICLSLNTWYTISGVYNTKQKHTLKTLNTIEFLKYELY